jgi:hypothetical protein
VLSASVSRSLRVAAVTGFAACLAAGCASSQHAGAAAKAAQPASVSSPHQAILLAATQARLATSFSADFTMSVGGTAGMTASGTMSAQTRPTLLVEANLPTVSADGQSVPGGISEIITANALYMKMSELSKVYGKAWLELPFSELKGISSLSLGQLSEQMQSDSPLQQTQMLAGATNVRTVGSTTIDGSAVTEYSGTYPLAAGIAQLPASSRAAVQQELTKAGMTSASFEIWLDDQHQVRKLVITEHGTTESVVLSELVTSINQPVSVQVPPASQVATMPASALGSGQ